MGREAQEQIQKQQQQYEEQRRAREEARKADLLSKDFSQHPDVDALYADLSVAEIKLLTQQSASFKSRLEELHNAGTDVARKEQVIARFRGLTDLQQQEFLKTAPAEVRAIIDADYDAFVAGQNPPPETPAPITQEQTDAEKAAALQAEADRLAAEAAAQGVIPTVPKGSVEELYDGVEKLSEGNYKLTVDPGDGTPPEIFYGTSQKECFKALRKSKASATKELRRRRKALQITDDLRALQGDIVNYPPLVAPISLTPDEIFDLTKEREKLEDDLSDPAKVLRAKKKLREIDQKLELASLTPEECDQINKPELERRYKEGRDTAAMWIRGNPEFYPVVENIQKFQELMSGLNWAVTISNMDKAFGILKEQDVLVERPETSTEAAVPASVVPAVTPVTPTPAAPAPQATPAATPTATSGALPETPRVLRPGSSSTGMMPTRRVDSASAEPPKVVLTAEMYNSMPAAEVTRKYQRDPVFKAAVDRLITEGKI